MLQVEPRVEVLMKDLVIYLTQGPKPAHMPDRSEVLHFDVIEGHFEGRSQIQWQQLQPWEAIVQRKQADKGMRPAHVPCNSRKCFSPLCLFYGSKSENGETGRTHWHLKNRKLKGRFSVCPPDCPKCQRWIQDQANRTATKAAKQAAAAAAATKPRTPTEAASTAAAGAASSATPSLRRSSKLASSSNSKCLDQ